MQAAEDITLTRATLQMQTAEDKPLTDVVLPVRTAEDKKTLTHEFETVNADSRRQNTYSWM